MHMGLLERLSFSKHGREPMFLILSNWKHTRTSSFLQRSPWADQEQNLTPARLWLAETVDEGHHRCCCPTGSCWRTYDCGSTEDRRGGEGRGGRHVWVKGRERCYRSQLVVAEIQVDQRVELGEAGEVIQLVPRQVQGLDVAQVGVCRLQEPQVVIGQIHMDQIVQVLQ